ncbi:6902_t:CDS:2 [Rhizophagus irregularis]|nr:6902_t:CDS:2 [Rhizophagus irregularis]
MSKICTNQEPDNDSWPSLSTPIGRKRPLKTSAKKDPKSSDKSSKKFDKKIKSQ